MRLIAPFDIVKESGGQFPLSYSARNWTVLWLVLKAVGWTSAMAADPSSPPVRLTLRAGKGSFADGLISNPAFYELTMGWPIGWTEPGAPVTGFAAWLRASRGQLLRLRTAFGEEALAAL
ncbi:MAG: site-specific methylase [Caulobacter sp.]|nr:site-specific methylase [Caulobacter sp.]